MRPREGIHWDFRMIARRYFVKGRVQGVGYRYFVEREASLLGVQGYVQNLDDGRVEVYAAGDDRQLARLRSLLWEGPRFAHVTGVEEMEAALIRLDGFRIRSS
jgi:acylphosphatase